MKVLWLKGVYFSSSFCVILHTISEVYIEPREHAVSMPMRDRQGGQGSLFKRHFGASIGLQNLQNLTETIDPKEMGGLWH